MPFCPPQAPLKQSASTTCAYPVPSFKIQVQAIRKETRQYDFFFMFSCISTSSRRMRWKEKTGISVLVPDFRL